MSSTIRLNKSKVFNYSLENIFLTFFFFFIKNFSHYFTVQRFFFPSPLLLYLVLYLFVCLQKNRNNHYFICENRNRKLERRKNILWANISCRRCFAFVRFLKKKKKTNVELHLLRMLYNFRKRYQIVS